MDGLNLISRRRLLTMMALSPLLWQMRSAQAAEIDTQRIVGLEWLPVELLLALGIKPYGIADIPNYNLWVNEPALPAGVIDVGLRTEPNLELLTQMKPSFLVWSAGYGPSADVLARIAPGQGFNFSDGKKPLATARKSSTRWRSCSIWKRRRKRIWIPSIALLPTENRTSDRVANARC
jgi:iron complex transport system substrate-binding protein